MPGEKNQSFMKGAAILTASTLIVKLLGLLFSVPLANFLSDVGMAYFYKAYEIFTVLLMLSTAGFPLAVSRMVSAAWSRGRVREADEVFSVALWLFLGVGGAGFLFMLIFARPVAGFLGEPGAAHAIMALSPTLLFVSICSVIRGSFQGRSDMVPTAVSQIIESVSKVIIGIGLALYFVRVTGSDDLGAVGAIIGVTLGSVLTALYLMWRKSLRTRREAPLREQDPGADLPSRRALLGDLLRFAIPITIGSCFLNLLDMLDGAVLMNRLKLAAGFSQLQADLLYTALSNARKYFDLPGAFIVPVCTSLLPVLSGAIASGDRKGGDRITSMALRVALLIGLPSSVGMSVFARPICDLFLPGKPETAATAAPLLSVLSAAIVFNGVLMITNSILQSYGRPVVPVINMGIGGLVKIALSYLLCGIPEINVMGSAVSTLVSYLLIMVLNLIALRRNIPDPHGLFRGALTMLGCAGVMGLLSYGFYRLLCLGLSPRVAVLPAILAAVLIYAVCVVLSRAVGYEEVVLLPKGETLARLFRMKKPEGEDA